MNRPKPGGLPNSKKWVAVVALWCCLVSVLAAAVHAEEKLMIFCGAAFRLPMEEITAAFSKNTGHEVNVNYAAVPTLLSHLQFGRRGDLLVMPSPDMMENVRDRRLIAPASLRNIGYVVPAINVRKGNPKGIERLKDMARPGIRVALANPELVFAGMLGAEIVDKSLSPKDRDQFRENIVTCPEDLSKLATLLALKHVDAVIGFSCLSGWHPDKIETIKLQAAEVYRIGAGQAALISHSKHSALAERFLDFLLSPESRNIFKKYHYFATVEEAIAWVGAKKPVGGTYPLPGHWTGR
jgi:molybdate transport system substrate-binding protein